MADGTPPSRQMSLIPYASDSRDIVLRRGNAVVLYDSHSRQLSVRDDSEQPLELADCPYCHRPLRGEEAHGDSGKHGRRFSPDGPFVDPDYFAMLAASQRPSPSTSGQSTPSRHIFHPALRSGRSREVSAAATDPPTGAEFVASEPSASGRKGISSSAFSPGFFKQFFKEEGILGRGGNGVVLLVEHIMDGVSLGHFACKRIPVGDSHTWLEKVLVEVKLLQRMPHRNIVTCHWTWLEDFQTTKFGPSIPYLWILQDFCNGGDLQNYVLGPQEEDADTPQRRKERLRRGSRGEPSPPRNPHGASRLSLEEIFSFFRDITSGLHHLHSKGYIHRDLKPSNCLLQRDAGKTRVLISDFGEVQEAGAVRGSTGATGTISYCAPEVLRRSGGSGSATDGPFGNFTTRSDVFSLGMIVYFMCFGRLPYANADGLDEAREDVDALRAEISSWPGLDPQLPRPRPDLPDRLYRFLRRLLSLDPALRPSTDEILSGIIIAGGGDPDAAAAAAIFEEPHLSPPSPSSSSSSRIIPPVDSPAPSSMPPSRRRKMSALIPRRRGSGELVRSRSPTKFQHQPQPQQQHDSATTTAARPGRVASPVDGSVALRPRKIELPPPAQHVASPHQSPRLLLPAPPARGRSVGEKVVAAVGARGLRVGVCLVKVVAMTGPCGNYSVTRGLFYPLLVFAVLEVGVLRAGWRESGLSFAIHMMVVFIAYRYGRLCEGRGITV